MSVEKPRATHDVGPSDHTWTSQDLAALDELVDRVRRDPTDLALELELETAREELRVADEEMRVQRDQLEELLRLSQATTVQRRRIATLLPVPMMTMDTVGKITEANAAAAALVNVPLVRLVGKPLVTFVHESERGVVRDALNRVTPDPDRVRLHLLPRRSAPLAVDLVLTASVSTDPARQVECTLLTASRPDHSSLGVDPVGLAAAVTAISRLPVGDHDVRRLLTGVARTGAAAMGEGVWVSVNLGHPGAPTQLASSAEQAAAVDGLQVRTGEGPCLSAFDEQETVLVDDLADQPRWPRLRAAWGDSPAAAVLGVPLVASGEKVGCLNCYSATPGAFTESQAQAAEVLALAVGAALEAVEETRRLREVASQLDQALASRAVIDQAKGIVMARRGCTADEAFAHLAALSQQRNVKVRDLALALVEQTGTPAGGGASVSRRRS
jgi:GAF domain-containing protein